MTFKTYDILSSLIPGFLVLLLGLNWLDESFDKDLVIAYTAIAFLIGYFINTFASWLEPFYNWTWGGQPSKKLLDGKSIKKVPFHLSSKVKPMLAAESKSASPTNRELFSIAMIYANGNSRVDDFNALYAFSRSILTTMLFASLIILSEHYYNIGIDLLCFALILISWIRCKQRSYYYAREVLNIYLKIKSS